MAKKRTTKKKGPAQSVVADQMFTRAQAAKRIGVSLSCLVERIGRGEVKVVRMGSAVRVRRAEVERLREEELERAGYLSRNAVSKRLCVSLRFVAKVIAAGDLPVIRKGHRVYIRPRDLERFVEARECQVSR